MSDDSTAALLRLQDIDLALMRARKRLDEMPEKREILATRKRAADLGKLLERAQAAVDAVQKEVSRLDDETSLLDEKIDHEQAKVMSGELTNPKEVQAVTRELDSLSRRKSKLEDDELEAMQKVEQAAAQRDKVVTAIEQGKTAEAAQVADFQKKGGEIVAEIKKLEAQRGPASEALDPDLLKRYEAARDAHHGVGVGVLEDSTCRACRVSLPTTKVEALKAAGPLGVCPNCRRLLVTIPPKGEGE